MGIGIWKGGAALAAVLVLAGCATSLQRTVAETGQSAAAMIEPARENLARRGDTTYETIDAVWLGSTVEEVDGDPERAALLEQYVAIQRGHPLTLTQIAEALRAQRVAVTVTADALAAAATMPADPLDAGTEGEVPGAVRVDYAGSLSGLLDMVTARTGTYWEVADGGVVIARLLTRQYQIASIPGRSGSVERMGLAAGGQGGGGGSGGEGGGSQTSTSASQETTMEVDVDVIEPAAEAINSMLSEEGRMAVAAGIGLVTVTDVPGVHARIKSFVEDVNRIVTRQALIEVQVVSVELADGNSYGIDWNLVRTSMSTGNELEMTSFSDGVVGSNAASYAIFDPTSAWAGSSVIVEALRTQGQVTVETDARVPTLSHTPTPINISDEIAYLARVESSIVSGIGGVGGTVQVSLTPGVATTGFAMQLLPVIYDDEILLQFSSKLSQLRELRTVSGGSGPDAARIEVPTISKRDTMQRVRLRSGQTLALWGFTQDRTRDDARGIGSPSFTALGGGRNTNSSRTVLVILVTPRVLG